MIGRYQKKMIIFWLTIVLANMITAFLTNRHFVNIIFYGLILWLVINPDFFGRFFEKIDIYYQTIKFKKEISRFYGLGISRKLFLYGAQVSIFYLLREKNMHILQDKFEDSLINCTHGLMEKFYGGKNVQSK